MRRDDVKRESDKQGQNKISALAGSVRGLDDDGKFENGAAMSGEKDLLAYLSGSSSSFGNGACPQDEVI